MVFDFALILVVATALTGAIWAADALWLRAKRGRDAKEPLLVEYSRSFFPILLIVLIVRSFLYEPFRIPSSSMVPTLLTGDFIFVSKFAYGLRLPVTNQLILPLGEPERGDVVVFRLPSEPSVNYIKRLVGLPGDEIRYVDKRLTINGQAVPIELSGIYLADGENALLGVEQLGDAEHYVLLERYGAGKEGTYVVPEGHYFFMGDNRDNSRDSRYTDEVGFVPQENLVGKAVRIWLNWDFPHAPKWSRIGDPVH